jgi:hypothetical protein
MVGQMDAEKVEELDNQLYRRHRESDVVPGIPIPSWMPPDEIPPAEWMDGVPPSPAE